MTPCNIAAMAKQILGLDVIAVTDHNSAKNCQAVMKAGEEQGLLVIPGMELCTNEEIHAVCLFETLEQALSFDRMVEEKMFSVDNDPSIFGRQIVMNEHDEPVDEVKTLLVNAADISLYEAAKLVSSLGGVIFPAHIDRSSYSVLSALGDFPPDLGFTAYEVSRKGDAQALMDTYPVLQGLRRLQNSDAHRLEDISEAQNILPFRGGIRDILTYIKTIEI